MPREGCKLLVRNSKGSGQEDYYVDSIEVVSFGRSFFFRSQERPKSFLVPVSDYEILEVKEVRASLKNASPERSIKIGGGREGMRSSRESVQAAEEYELEGRAPLNRQPVESSRKRDKRHRSRRGGRSESSMREMREPPLQETSLVEKEGSEQIHAVTPASMQPAGEESKAPSFISKLFPPPPTLIKDSLSRYKTAEAEESEISLPKEEKYEEDFFEEKPPFDNESKEEEEPPFDQ